MRDGPWLVPLLPPLEVLEFPVGGDRMDATEAPTSIFPPPGSEEWCGLLIEWKGNLSRFPGPITDDLVQTCLANEQVSKEYLEPPQYHWLALVLLAIPLAGVLGNSLVCIAVWQERRLHNVTNFFLVSLALADLMVCLAVMPFGVLELFYGKLNLRRPPPLPFSSGVDWGGGGRGGVFAGLDGKELNDSLCGSSIDR